MSNPKKPISGKVIAPLRKKPTAKSKNKDKSVKTGKNPIDKSRLTKVVRGKKRPSVALIGGLQDAGRFRFIWLLMALGFLALFGRAFWLQVANATYYIEQGDKLITATQTIPVYRGMIFDTNGLVLAANAPLSTVVFSPYDYALAYYETKRLLVTAKSDTTRHNAEKQLARLDLSLLSAASNIPLSTFETATKLNPTLDVTNKKAVNQALPTGAGSKRLILLNKVPPEIAESVLSLKFKGVSEEKIYRRYYLQPEPMAQLLGYMAQSNDKNNPHYIGRAGIESRYEKLLAGESGKILTLRSAHGSIEEIKELKPEIASQDVHLTIDSRLQYVLYKELEKLGRTQSALSSSGIVVDVHTGDVLAIGSWPSFNSNNLSERTGDNERNRVVLDVFEPGSVMKPFTVAAALESGTYTTNTLIDTTPGSIKVGGYTIKDSANYGAITLGKLIQKSSNVASAKIAQSLSNDAIANIQQRFGFGQKSSLNLPAEESGSVKAPSDVTRRVTMSYGYGQQVTLAQIAQAYAILANNGVKQPLHLVKHENRGQPAQIISAKHAQSIIAMMKSVTEQGGTGTAAAINGYHVAGKTGTSRRASPTGGYSNEYRNIFAGIAPASNPRFVVAILVEDPKKGKYAGQTVAPVFAKVMQETLRLYNVPYDKPLETND